MSPSLEKAIRLARHRQQGLRLTEDEMAKEARKQAIMNFEIFVAERIPFRIHRELFESAAWNWDGEAASVEFGVDEHQFRLLQIMPGCQLLLCDRGTQVPIAFIADDRELFSDRLLIAIDDILQKSNRLSG